MKRLLLAVGAAMQLAALPVSSVAETAAKDIVDFIEAAAAESPIFEFGYESLVENEDGLILRGVAFESDSGWHSTFAVSIGEAEFVETSTGEVSVTLSSPIRYRFLVRDEIGLKEQVLWEHHDGYHVRVREEDGTLEFNLSEQNVELKDRDNLSVVSSFDQVEVDLRVTPDGEISFQSRLHDSVFGSSDKADGVAVGVLGTDAQMLFRTSPDSMLVGSFQGEADQIEVSEASLSRVAPQLAELFREPSSLTFDLSTTMKFDEEDEASDVALRFHELTLHTLGVRTSMSGDLTVVESEATPGENVLEGQLKVVVDGGSGLSERLMRIRNENAIMMAATLEFLFAFASPGPGGNDSKLFDIELLRDGSVLVNGINVSN